MPRPGQRSAGNSLTMGTIRGNQPVPIGEILHRCLREMRYGLRNAHVRGLKYAPTAGGPLNLCYFRIVRQTAQLIVDEAYRGCVRFHNSVDFRYVMVCSMFLCRIAKLANQCEAETALDELKDFHEVQLIQEVLSNLRSRDMG